VFCQHPSRLDWFQSDKICSRYLMSKYEVSMPLPNSQLTFAGFIAAFCCSSAAALGANPLAVEDALANSSQAEGLTLVTVLICMLFIFALSLVIAQSVRTCKEKPVRARADRVACD
jgi:hypothetical protein